MLVTIATITAWFRAGIWHLSMSSFVGQETLLIQKLCGALITFVDAY